MAGEWIAAGAAALSTVANTANQAKSNRKSRRLVREENQKARDFALADWNRTNEYNSPAAQMARFKAAGLNPNLIYGEKNEAPAVASYKANAYEEQAPQVDTSALSQGLNSYYDNQLKTQTADNLLKQNEVLQKEIELKDSQIANTNANTSSTLQNTTGSSFDLSQRQRLADTNFEAAVAALDKTRADVRATDANTAFTLSQNERAAVAQESSLKEAATRILQMRSQMTTDRTQRAFINQQIRNLQTDKEIKDLELKMKKEGKTFNDPYWLRRLENVVQGDYIIGGNEDARKAYKLGKKTGTWKGSLF